MTNLQVLTAREHEPILEVINCREALTAAGLDPAVKIRIAPLAGDESMMFYITELTPGSKVTAHVHQEGLELYHILRGMGEMYIGTLVNEVVNWNEPVKVREGDVFKINPGMVHQLKNASETDSLVLMFGCPPAHLKEDRVLTSDYTAR